MAASTAIVGLQPHTTGLHRPEDGHVATHRDRPYAIYLMIAVRSVPTMTAVYEHMHQQATGEQDHPGCGTEQKHLMLFSKQEDHGRQREPHGQREAPFAWPPVWPGPVLDHDQIFSRRKRSAFKTTDSEEELIANAAKIGPISMPKNG